MNTPQLDPAELVAAMPDIARALLGEPNRQVSRPGNPRYGTHGSLSIDLAKGVFHDKEAGVGGGVIDLVVRERGGTRAEAVEWLQSNGFLKAPTISKSVASQPQRTFYDYCDADGVVRYRVERRNGPEGKTFRQHGPDGRGGFICAQGCMEGVERLPYHLDKIAASDADDAPIYIVEGEKDADRLTSLGLIATCNSGGANKWPDTIGHWFTGRRVVIIGDNDEPGRLHAADVAGKLRDIAASVVVVDLPGLPEKGDVSDWLDRGGTLAELNRLIDEAARQVQQTASPVLTILDPAKWHGEAPPAREWSVSEWIPLKQATYLTGKGSAGKSLLAQQLATCISLGLPFLGQRTKEAPAFYITAEDDADELWRRQAAICRSLNITLSALHDRLHLVSLAGEIGNELVTFDDRGKLRIEPRFHHIEAAVAGHDGAFIALDNVAHFTADEIRRSSVAGFMSTLNRLAMSVGGSLLILGHPNKIGAEFSGSTAWENQVRSRLYLETPTDEHGVANDRDARVLTRSKSNYARNGEQIAFRWHEWAFVRDEDLPTHIRQTIADTVTAGAENAAFLECLAVCAEKQRAVSHVPGVNYAPKVFAKMTEAKRYPESKLAGAMNRLWNMGVILFDQQLWKGTDRHWKHGIARAEKCGDPPAGTPCGDHALSDCNSLREPCGGDPPYTTYNGAPSHEVGAPSSFEESETDFAASNEAEF